MQGKYYITESCLHCGCCRFVCPEKCIAAGRPHVIDEKKCIGCGKCVDVCFRKAILPRGEIKQ